MIFSEKTYLETREKISLLLGMIIGTVNYAMQGQALILAQYILRDCSSIEFTVEYTIISAFILVRIKLIAENPKIFSSIGGS